MTLQSVVGVFYPDYSQYGRLMNGVVGFGGSTLIDAATEKVAFVFMAPKTGTLGRVGFRTNTVNTGDTLKVSFQDVSATTGDPDGVADQFRTVVVADVDDNVWFRTGLITSDGTDGGAKRSVTKGDILAIVIEFNSFVAGSINIAAMSAFGAAAGGPFATTNYIDFFTGAWSHAFSAFVGVYAVEYDDGSFAYISGSCPVDASSSSSHGSGSTPDEVALRFSVPFSASVGGFWAAVTLAGDADIILYDSDGTTPLLTKSLDKDMRASSANAIAAPFASSVTLTANTFYRLAMKPTSVTTNTQFWVTVPSTPGVAQLDQLSGGQNCHWSERTDAGAWTNVTTKRPLLGVIFDGLDDGLTAGGISRAALVNAGGL